MSVEEIFLQLRDIIAQYEAERDARKEKLMTKLSHLYDILDLSEVEETEKIRAKMSRLCNNYTQNETRQYQLVHSALANRASTLNKIS
jgi:hypothetical protein